MIARPQADLLNMLPVTQVTPLAAKALEGGVNTLRFDAALLEAAKTMRDSAPQAPELALVPKVQAAFENALSELAQKPVDQLKTLIAQPQAAKPEIAALVTRIAQAAGLNADEQKALNDLVPLALPRLLDLKANIQVPGTTPTAITTTNGGEQPGPQGRTPVTEASPVDTDTSLEPSFTAQPQEQDPRATRDAQSQAGSGLLLSQLPSAPILLSTRTDDGSGKSSALSQAGNVSSNSTGTVTPPPAASAPLAPKPAMGAEVMAPAQPEGDAPQGRVIQLSATVEAQAGSVPPPPAEAPSAPAQAEAPAAVDARAPQGPRSTSAQAPAPQPGSDAAVRALTGADGTVTLAQAAAPQSAEPQGPATQPRAQAPLPAAQGAPSQPLATDLDLQFQDPSQPLAVRPESVLTLKEDGTWSQPAPAPAPAASTIAPQGAREAAPAPMQAQQGPVAPALQAPVLTPTTTASIPAAGAPLQAPAPAPETAVASSPVVPAVQTQAAAPATPQLEAQPQAAAAAPRIGSDGAVESKPTLADAFQAPVQPAPARRSAADSAFSNLAQQQSPDPLKAVAQQTARDYSVRESVFKQVYEALREAPSTESGRMLIRLKPAELGEVHVDLILVNGKLSARLVASQTEVRDAFARDLQSFKAGLESQGVSVSEISVAVRAGVDQQQQQPQRQADAQAWWRQLPRPDDNTPSLGMPASAGYTNLSVTDQRFSALA